MPNRLPIVAVCLVLACGPAPRPPPVATISDYDAGSSDASADADMPVSVDAGDSHPPGTWCAEHRHDLCDDFDDPAFTAKTWLISDSLGTSGTGIPPRGALESASVTSAPNAFASMTSALAANAFETVQIMASSTVPAGKDHVEADFAFDVRVQVGAGAQIEIARVKGVNPINFRDYDFSLLVTQTGASIVLQPGSGGGETHALARAPAIGVWTRITIHLGLNVVVTGPPTAISIQIGDGAAESFSLAGGMGVRPFLYLGAKVAGPADACVIDYDDVTYDAR